MKLPESFCLRMQEMLGAESYNEFIKSYDCPREFGLRVNTDKISCEEFEKICPFPIERIPWIPNGYYYKEESRPGQCPYYQAGLYYLQEPSAMTPASRIPVSKGEYVLDLCAAPGGKSTALANLLSGEGILIANDISGSRCKALLRNLELFGVSNSIITNETPSKLADFFPSFFHKIILDAPCSGEGMFRKEEAMAMDWTPEKSEEIAKIQRELILLAVKMLRPGGMLLYSTCTFAPIENEGTISFLLEEHPEMEVLEMPTYEGFTSGNPAWGNGDARLTRCVRIFPHKMNGEGHFLALLKKPGTLDVSPSLPLRAYTGSVAKRKGKEKKKVGKPAKEQISFLTDFLTEIGLSSFAGFPFDLSRVEIHADKVYYLPPVPVDGHGLTFLRKGIFLGDLKKNRFEPSEPFALAIKKSECASVLTLPVNDDRVLRYLKGETLQVDASLCTVKKGWVLVTVDGYPLGWGKLVGETLKNKYPTGWRIF